MPGGNSLTFSDPLRQWLLLKEVDSLPGLPQWLERQPTD